MEHFLSIETNSIMNLDINSTSGDENPLRVFVSAKRDINEILNSVEKFVKSMRQLYNLYDPVMMEAESNINYVESSIEKIANIKDILARNHMKVAFFGRTSNGKSTVINSILQNKILPAGIGHTTNCFLQVEGTDESEPYMMIASDTDDNKRLNIESVKNLANALNTESLGDSTLVKIYWPKSKCSILHDDVVLVDSPGTDVTANLDKWIDLHCLDADVFVLVSNAESTLMQTEKNFFLKVKEKLSKPNIFILNNRWDASAQEPESLELVRKQHFTRDVNFLVDELNVVDKENASNHVFFVSAKEVLHARSERLNGREVQASSYANGFEGRYMEFVEFEKKFEQCLSESAVKTKFGQHTQEVIKITSDMNNLLDDVFRKTSDLRHRKINQIKELKDRLNFIKQKTQIFTNEVKLQICHLVKQVEINVSTALNEEILRLSGLVNDFEKPFSVDSIALNIYKKDLHSYVEQGLGSNLKSRLSNALSCNIESTQKQMIDGVKSFIPEICTDSLLDFSISHQQDFKLIYRLNCESLCSDFQEDLEFRFSYGFVQILRLISGSRSPTDKNASLSQSLPSNSNEQSIVSYASDKLDVIDKLANSRTSITVLAIGGCLVRFIGWHVIAITSTIYGFLYVYERLSWTTRAKESAFKKQYVSHATKKLRLIINLTSANCSHQVQQQLLTTFTRLNRMVDKFVSDLNEDIQKLQKEVEFLNQQDKMISVLKNQVKGVLDDLQNFSDHYL